MKITITEQQFSEMYNNCPLWAKNHFEEAKKLLKEKFDQEPYDPISEASQEDFFLKIIQSLEAKRQSLLKPSV